MSIFSRLLSKDFNVIEKEDKPTIATGLSNKSKLLQKVLKIKYLVRIIKMYIIPLLLDLFNYIVYILLADFLYVHFHH